MIDLAIYIEDNSRGIPVVETNNGKKIAAPRWPHDSESRLVAFSPSGKECDVVCPEELARDIAIALKALEGTSVALQNKPDWYRRLEKCAKGARHK